MTSEGTTPLVSVVVRSMARPTLARALESLAAQDYPRMEVVLASALGAAHPPPPARAGPHPVRFVPSAQPLSRPQAANAGQDAAAGEWITFLDDDDTLLPTHVGGLVQATQRAGSARFVHSLAEAVLADGSTRYFGQPMAPTELYQRNFIHMSTALWSRTLVAEGARFDERCTTHQDWDFFQQCAQVTRFHFEPLRTFRWYADIGESGTWGGANLDNAQIERMCALIFDKWKVPRDALNATVAALRTRATEAAQRRDFAGAARIVDELLDVNQNDPFALSLRAGMAQAQGDWAAAEAAQTLAVSVRPHDATLVYALALIHRQRGNADKAGRLAQVVLKLAPGHPGAQQLLATLRTA